MRAVLDACVLYPTVLREILTGCAGLGLYEPRWSDRILEEWVRATAKLGPEAPVIARGEATALALRFPQARVAADSALEQRLWLPDPADVHVLACAITGHADAIITFNAADFPRGILDDHMIQRMDPDTFLLVLHDRAPGPVAAVVAEVLATARRLSGQDWTARALLKKARLFRLARVLD
jgi:predicted nucleic acid-binding protein